MSGDGSKLDSLSKPGPGSGGLYTSQELGQLLGQPPTTETASTVSEAQNASDLTSINGDNGNTEGSDMPQTDLTPHPKVVAATAAGAAVAVVLWVLSIYGVQVPSEVAAALSTLAAFAGGYLKAS